MHVNNCACALWTRQSHFIRSKCFHSVLAAMNNSTTRVSLNITFWSQTIDVSLYPAQRSFATFDFLATNSMKRLNGKKISTKETKRTKWFKNSNAILENQQNPMNNKNNFRCKKSFLHNSCYISPNDIVLENAFSMLSSTATLFVARKSCKSHRIQFEMCKPAFMTFVFLMPDT